MRTLDLNLLRALDALLDERSVTRAAERLALTQPAVSGILTRLRESFDDPLFVRTQRGISPTPRALELAAPLKRILGSIDTLLQPASFDPAHASFTLTIAATDYALRAVAVPFLARLRAAAPGIRISVRSLNEERVSTRLERGELDLALVTPDSVTPELHTHRLFEENYVCALREGHPDAATPTIPLDRFCALDHALVSLAGDRFLGVTDEALAAIGRERRVAFSVTCFLVLAEMLRSTDLVAVVPQRVVSPCDGLVTRDVPVPVPGFTKLAAWHDRTDGDAGHRWVRELLFDTCGAAEITPAETCARAA